MNQLERASVRWRLSVVGLAIAGAVVLGGDGRAAADGLGSTGPRATSTARFHYGTPDRVTARFGLPDGNRPA